jgi:hypothetical protein
MPVALVLTITTGRVDPARAEQFQVTFQTLFGRRFDEASYLRQAMLVHLGNSVWQMLTLWDSALAQSHAVDNDVPLTVRIFRDFGVEPEIQLADVSSFLQPRRTVPRPAAEAPAAEVPTSEAPTAEPSPGRREEAP